MIFVIDLLQWGTHGPARIVENRLAYYISANFRKYLYENTLALPLTYHNTEHSGQIISKITKGVSSLDRFSQEGFLIIRTFFSIFAVLVALAFVNIYFVYFALLLLMLTCVTIYLFENTINPLRDKMNKSDNILSEIIFDTISNITTIKMLSLDKNVKNSIDKEVKNKFIFYKKQIVLDEMKWYAPSLIGTVFITGTLIYYVYNIYIVGSVLMLGSLYTLYNYLFKLKGVLYSFAWMLGTAQERNRDLINSKSLSDNFSTIEKINTKQVSHIESIELKDMYFKYGEAYDLNIANLKLEKGKKYAFVGESGCGKTTTLKILASLIKVEKYNLKINGTESTFENIKELSMLIPQEPELFSNTVRENITLGLPFSEKEVSEVLEIVNMNEVVDGLPEKIESKIYEKGANLSGGQKQRLALARGILFAKEKELLLLDEPTSSVDEESEIKIYKKIFAMAEKKVVVSGVHKKHLLKMFDYIVYFEKGKINRVEEVVQ